MGCNECTRVRLRATTYAVINTGVSFGVIRVHRGHQLIGVAATAPGYVYGPPPGPPPMRLSTPGSVMVSSAESTMGFATSAPGHFFGPSPMCLSIPGPAPGSPAGSTTGFLTGNWGHGPMGPPLIKLSTLGPATGISTGSTKGKQRVRRGKF